MSRSGYSDNYGDDYPGQMELYRSAVERAIKGKRGQLDAMPEKVLIADELINEEGDCCTIGVVCKARQIDMEGLDYFDSQEVGDKVGIARTMAAEIAYLNDEWVGRHESPAERWKRMRKWVADQTLPVSAHTAH